MQTKVSFLIRLTMICVAVGLCFLAMTLAAQHCIVSAAAFDVQHRSYGDSIRIQDVAPDNATRAAVRLTHHKRV